MREINRANRFAIVLYYIRIKAKIYLLRMGEFFKSIYETLHLAEIPFFFSFLFHRYSVRQFDPRVVPDNFRILSAYSPNQRFEANRKGKLRILETQWQRSWFKLKNALFFGAYQSRLEAAVIYTFTTISIELYNPFDKKVLRMFLRRKLALLETLLERVKTLNGRSWNRDYVRVHIDFYHRSSLLQYRVIDQMHQAVARQKVPAIIKDAQLAIKKGLYPILITRGSSGAYWIRNTKREVAGLFKPFDEEIHAPNNPVGPNLQGALGKRKTRHGCRVGESAHHEVAAFIVDKFFGFGIVPHTYYASFTHNTFFYARENPRSRLRVTKTKYGSFQEFLSGFIPVDELPSDEFDKIPLDEFQLLVVLDVILGNTDRNTGNLLIGEEKLAAIDHGLCFPDEVEDYNYWYWGFFEQGKKELYPAIIDLLKNFPLEELAWELKGKCFISQSSIDRMRERLALFTQGVLAGLVPAQMHNLLVFEYLEPLYEYRDSLPQRAKEQVEKYIMLGDYL